MRFEKQNKKEEIDMPTLNFAEAIRDALSLEMERDPDVYIIGEDVGRFGNIFGVTKGLMDQFGKERVCDTPIAESAIIGTAVGSAACGLRPVAEIMYIDFIGVALDQLYNQAAKMRYMFGGKIKIPLVLRGSCGAGKGGAAQHSQSLESWFMHVPGLKVVIPSTPADAKGLLTASIRDDNPVVFLEHKLLYTTKGEVPAGEYLIPLGKADIKREGRDLTIIATSRMVYFALNAAEKLAQEGIEVEIVDPRTLSPLDEETILESVKKTHRLVIVHEEVKFAGSGAEISAMVAENAIEYLDAPIVRIAAPFSPVPYSPVLESGFIPDEDKIIDAVKRVMMG
jgi:pyruvate dehydrogenase E1 component beta subunit